jgi:hypothetical protein
VEDWAKIRRLHRAEGMAIRAIARRLGISRNTVKRVLASVLCACVGGGAGDPVAASGVPGGADGRDHGAGRLGTRETVFLEWVAQLRTLFRPPDPASRTE